MPTFVPTAKSIESRWHVIDAEGQVLGRIATTAARLVEEAVRGMLPKTKLGDAMYRKLKVYAGAAHPHAAQKPSKIEVA